MAAVAVRLRHSFFNLLIAPRCDAADRRSAVRPGATRSPRSGRSGPSCARGRCALDRVPRRTRQVRRESLRDRCSRPPGYTRPKAPPGATAR